jgi:hypothetical protein
MKSPDTTMETGNTGSVEIAFVEGSQRTYRGSSFGLAFSPLPSPLFIPFSIKSILKPLIRRLVGKTGGNAA